MFLMQIAAGIQLNSCNVQAEVYKVLKLKQMKCSVAARSMLHWSGARH